MRQKIHQKYIIIWGALALAAILFIVTGTSFAGSANLGAAASNCGPLAQEAEAGSLNGKMTFGTGNGRTYIFTPKTEGYSDEPHPNNRADYCVTVEKAGTYLIEAYADADNSGVDSMWVTFEENVYLWDTGVNKNFAPVYVSDRGKGDIKLNLSAGNHLISFHQREAGVHLDRFTFVPIDIQPAVTQPATATNVPAQPPAATADATCGPLRQEAEHAQLTGAMTIGDSSIASGKKYIFIPTSAGHADQTPDLENKADFCFTAPADGDYIIKAGAHAPDSSHDSFHVTVDGGPAKGYLWQPPAQTGFIEDVIHDRGKNSEQIISLTQGDHTITFHRRESATLLDWVELVLVSTNGQVVPPTAPTHTPTAAPTNAPATGVPTDAPTSAPTQAAATATATNVPPTATPTKIPPTATPNAASCDSLMLEAESGVLHGNFTIGDHSNASGGKYIYVPNRYGDAANGKIDRNQRADFCINVVEAGEYTILGRVLAPNSSQDSFFVTVDSAPAAGHLWDVRDSGTFINDNVNNRSKQDPATFNLSAGKHIVSFYLREAGTMLDRFEMVLIAGAGATIPAPVATASPTPTKPAATATSVPPTPTSTSVPATPNSSTCFGLSAEAEAGSLTGNFAESNDSNASGGKYIQVPNQFPDAPNGKIDLNNKADFCFTAQESGEYRLIGRAMAPSGSNDSFFVRIDNAPAAGHLWDVKLSGSFVNDYLNDRGKSDPTTFYLAAGEHTISIHLRETGTKLDKLELVLVSGSGGTIPTATPTATPTSPPVVSTVVPTPTAAPPQPTPGSNGGNASGTLLNPLDISFNNPSWSGNPFDLVAVVTFTHQGSNTQRQTEMYYNGGNEWKARFTADRTGTWTYATQSNDSDLNSIGGTISISGSNAKGFVVANGDKWARSGNGEVFVPQYLMAAELDRFHDDPGKLNRDLNTFMGEHGFTGFHIRGYCHWFDLGNDRCRNISSSDTDPDIQTFEVVESIILETYARGGTTHIWMYGDNSRTHNPTAWGLNGTIDQRMQRYFAARLGALPGWTMGYGYDISEWAPQHQIEKWYNYLDDRMMYAHLMSARGNKNSIMQHSEILSYSGYEKHNPDYNWYVTAINDRSNKPSFSEDRFRIDQAFATKDYTFEETRRGMWHSAMAGGIANIWGNMQFDEGGSYQEGSRVYPNKTELKTYSNFMTPRFRADLETCNSLTNGMCLKNPINTRFIFYRENASSISLNLKSMTGSKPFVAVNTKTGQTITGTFQAGQQTWNAPSQSDWAIAVGNW
ncbi:MAG: DUF5060 domain-containing protein [Anaerolineae bacterium]